MIPRHLFLLTVLSLLMVGCTNVVKDCADAGAVRIETLEDGMVACIFENPILTATGSTPPTGFEGPDVTDSGMNPSNN